jgi:hypothetical protein
MYLKRKLNRLCMKLYFLSSIMLAVVYTFQIINKDYNARMRIIVPVLILFLLTFYSFVLEYEKQRRSAWGKKEKRLVDNVYSKYMELYFRKKDSPDNYRKRVEEEKNRWVENKLNDNPYSEGLQ